MIKELLCTFSSEAQVADAASRMKYAGLDPSHLIVVSRPTEVGNILRPDSVLAYQAKMGAAIGAVVGWLIGIAIVLYSDSMPYILWGGVSVIMLSQSVGWAMFGAIVGAGGAFAPRGLSSKVEHEIEEDVAEGRIVVAVRLDNANMKELDAIAVALQAAGAIRMHESGLMAA